MKRLLFLTLVAANTLFAQAPADPSQKVVAVINGETVTRGKLDALYSRLPPQMRAQYDQSGGKLAFLDNYISKRLMIQEAMKTNFEQQPEVKLAVEAAREAALFDQYIRDVIAADIVPETEVTRFYTQNAAKYATPEMVKARHIVVLFQGREKEQALEKIKQAMLEIGQSAAPVVSVGRFAEVAAKYSEDGTKTQGGDLGWFAAGSMDPTFGDAAFRLPPGTMSGIIESPYGYHLILVEAKRPAGTKPFEEVRNEIREGLLNAKMAEIMTAVQRVTSELRRASKVAIYRENLD